MSLRSPSLLVPDQGLELPLFPEYHMNKATLFVHLLLNTDSLHEIFSITLVLHFSHHLTAFKEQGIFNTLQTSLPNYLQKYGRFWASQKDPTQKRGQGPN